MTSKTFKIYTLGCKVNQYDSADLQGRLKSLGFTSGDGDCVLAIINTCAVTKTAIHKCRLMIRTARKENKNAKIIITGCWPKVYKKETKDLRVDLIWEGVINKDFFARLKKIITYHEKQLCVSALPAIDRSRYFIKIQDGCEQFCSYCIIPFARGKLKSREEKGIIKEVKLAVKHGFKEIVLSGIHLGLYGKDLKNNTNLALLLKELIKIKSLGRIRLSSIEATELTTELIALIVNSPIICKHLHIPLQSGDDKILKSMNRPYSALDFLKIVNILRKKILNIAITTDVIVGFPMETEESFKNTYRFLKKTKFSKLHIFPFSVHQKTRAAGLPGKVDQSVIKKRARQLRLLSRDLEENYRKKFINKNLAVVIENKSDGGITGKTEYYFNINANRFERLEDKELKVGQIVIIKYI